MKIEVIILGCTGVVGQHFIRLLDSHTQFEIVSLAASERSVGKIYKDAVQWRHTTELSEKVASMEIRACDPSAHPNSSTSTTNMKIAFSALDAAVAGPIEEAFAAAGWAVFSNARNHRLEPDVPLCVPFCNAEHLNMIHYQQKQRNRKGFIVTNANCSTTGLVVALQPLHERFGIEALHVVTLQAASGAGYPGVPSLDLIDNVVPYIGGEEDKLQTEPLKILGTIQEDADHKMSFQNAQFVVSAHCTRVPVSDGHTACVSIKFKQSNVTAEQVSKTLEEFSPDVLQLSLPSAPKQAIIVFPNVDRPQPKLDRDRGHGFTVTVGNVRKCPLMDVKFTLLSHNCVLGAAGSSLLNAEIAFAKGLLTNQ